MHILSEALQAVYPMAVRKVVNVDHPFAFTKTRSMTKNDLLWLNWREWIIIIRINSKEDDKESSILIKLGAVAIRDNYQYQP
jgi:hypothetical protein